MVTVFSGWKYCFFLQDATASISVDRSDNATPLVAGDVIRLTGVTGPGRFAPVVIAKSVRLIRHGTLRRPPILNAPELFGGKADSQYIAVRGIVRSATIKPTWGRPYLFLNVDIGAGLLISVRVHDFSPAAVNDLSGAAVVAQGVCGTIFNDRRQYVGIRLMVSSLNDIKVEKPALADPFQIPVQPIDSLLQFNGVEGDLDRAVPRAKVSGSVTYVVRGEGFYLQDKAQGIFVQSDQSTPVTVGSRVEAVGYPISGTYSPQLEDAIFRVVEEKAPLEPVKLDASRVFVNRDGNSFAPFDSLLVRTTGRLIEEVPGTQDDLLIFKDGTTVFTAHLPHTEHRRPLITGSLVSIIGICSTIEDKTHEERTFEILLRSPSDLTVLEAGPWWTAAHAKAVLVSLIAVALAVSGILVIMRRQVVLHTQAITDSLTGLYNRRGFLARAEQQFQLAVRWKIPLSLFFIDIDRFKEINDNFGHSVGDEALQEVADALRESVRKADIIGRMGGDEFAIVALDAGESTRKIFERRILEMIDQKNAKPDKLFQISLSMGVLDCDYSSGVTSVEALLTQADALMYERKKSRYSSNSSSKPKPDVQHV